MEGRTRALRALAAGLLLLAVAVPAAAAYEGGAAQTVSVTVPGGDIPCGKEFAVSATVLDANGQPVAQAEATWTLTTVVSSQDSIVDPTSMTDANGVATTMVWLDCIAGDREIEARVGDAFGGAVLGVTAGGLPNTSTLPAQTPTFVLLLVGAAVVVAAIFGVRTIATQR